MEQINTITREELEQKVSSGEDFVLLEVLSEEAYDREHLPGAIRFEGMEMVEGILTSKDSEVVAYCTDLDCHASTRLVRKLTGMGYRNIRDYEGGKKDWTNHGLPTESSEQRG